MSHDVVTAGALSVEDGLQLVRRRGELMAEQCEQEPGAMAAIVGLPIRTVPAVANVNADFVRTPEEIRATLIGQVDRR